MNINLSKYHTPGVIVFSGRERGAKLRQAERLDELDQEYMAEMTTVGILHSMDTGRVKESTWVDFPPEVLSLAGGFFLGLFGPSVWMLGEERFRRVYQFHCSNCARDDINQGILDTLRPPGGPLVMDMDQSDWDSIQQAARESKWMPPEYMRNDWVADVCEFLRNGHPEPDSDRAVNAVLIAEGVYGDSRYHAFYERAGAIFEGFPGIAHFIASVGVALTHRERKDGELWVNHQWPETCQALAETILKLEYQPGQGEIEEMIDDALDKSRV